MPFHKKTYQNGNLIIQFKVKFPEKMDAGKIQKIQEALGAGKVAGKKEEGDETVVMKEFKEFHRNTHHRGGQGENDSEGEEDEDGHPHGQRVGCQAQ